MSCRGCDRTDRASLLVIDECHHCKGNHPASALLRDFVLPHYKLIAESKATGPMSPRVLGLTASFYMGSTAKPNLAEEKKR